MDAKTEELRAAHDILADSTRACNAAVETPHLLTGDRYLVERLGR